MRFCANWFARLAIGRGNLIFFSIALGSAILGFYASQNTFDYDLKDMLGENREAFSRYDECLRIFGPDDDIYVGLPMETLDFSSIMEALNVRNALTGFPKITAIIDLALAAQISTAEDLEKLNGQPRRLKRVLESMKDSLLLKGTLISPDMKAQLVILRTEDMPQKEKQALVREVRKVLDEKLGAGPGKTSPSGRKPGLGAPGTPPSLDGRKAVLTGYPVYVERYVSLMTGENATFLVFSLFSSILVAFAWFRSFLITFAICLSVILPSIWIQGLYCLFGYKVSLFSSLLTPIVILVGLSFNVQFVARVQWIAGKSREEVESFDAIISRAISETFTPSVFCMITTVIGFGSQVFSSIRGVKAFGIMSSIGVFLSCVFTFSLLPAILFRFSRKDDFRMRSLGFERRVNRFLARLYLPSKLVIPIAIGLVALACFGMKYMEFGSDPLSALPQDDPVVKDHAFVSNHFGGGSRQISFILRGLKGPFDTLLSMTLLDRITNAIASDPQVAFVRSPSVLVSEIEREITGGAGTGSSRTFALKSDEEISRNLRMARAISPEILSGFLNYPFNDRAHLVVMLKVSDSVRVEAAADRLERKCLETGQGEISASATGRMLLSALIENEAIEIETGLFGTSLWIILLLIGLGFRSFRAFLVAFVANGFPVLMSLGCMGWFGAPVDSATAMAPCICIGIIEDDTIHLIHEFFEEKRKGHGPVRARVGVMLKIGWAMISTSLILIIGLGVICLSNFGPLQRFGKYSILTVVIGLFFEVILTPILLRENSVNSQHSLA